MDYELKYKEALELARDYHEDKNCFEYLKGVIENIFPELAESEDERIRKEISHFVLENTLSTDMRQHRWLAWLEKQVEQKDINPTLLENSPILSNSAKTGKKDPDLYSVTRKAVERALKNLWHDAQGNFLPEIDREVTVLCDDGYGGYKVCFGHRPNPKGYYGKNLTTGEKVSKYRYEVETYDKGGWNIPDVRWWLDVELPNMEDEQ